MGITKRRKLTDNALMVLQPDNNNYSLVIISACSNVKKMEDASS